MASHLLLSSFGTAQHFAKSDLAVSAPKAALDFAKASATASASWVSPFTLPLNTLSSMLSSQMARSCMPTSSNCATTPDQVGGVVWCHADTGKVIQAVDSPTRLRTRPSQFHVVMPLKDFQWWPIPNLRDLHQMDGLLARPLGAGNFQKDNFGKGGQDGDAVVVNVLNTSKVNNANFLRSPDGQQGEMNMFRFTYTTPSRSGGLTWNPNP
ncbi:hypothetical protein BASA83_013821 [Batrachochytrium salamandrivorans]|nr:hypothetical protein BASA83_013821 [Batrachochytrium salamandrivorans]